MKPSPLVRSIFGAVTVFGLILFTAPVFVVIAVSFSAGSQFALPSTGLGLEWYSEFLNRPEYIEAIQLSLIIGVLSASISTVLGTMAAFYISRNNARFGDILGSLFLAPLIVPQIIVGIGTLQFLSALGLTKGFVSLLIGHVIITIPYVVRSVLATLVGFDRQLEEASGDLGADVWTTFRKVTLPVVRPGLVAGWLFAFIMSWINVEISLFLVSSSQAPAPVMIFNYSQYSIDPSIAVVSAVSVYVAVILILVVDRMFPISKLMK